VKNYRLFAISDSIYKTMMKTFALVRQTLFHFSHWFLRCHFE